MDNLGVIRKVEEPTEWVNSFVLVTKPNGKLHVCLDPRNLNNAIKRELSSRPQGKKSQQSLQMQKYVPS